MDIKKTLLACMILAGTSFNSIAATEITLHAFIQRPPSFPITNMIVSWSGPCGTYVVQTNDNLTTGTWSTYATLLKSTVLNPPLYSSFSISPGTTPALFFQVEFTEAASQVDCLESPTVFLAHPQDQTVCEDDPTRLDAYNVGPEDRTHQWYLDGVSISGATGMTHQIEEAEAADAGDYHLVSSSSSQNITSDVAVLTVVSCAQSSSAPPPPPSFYSTESKEARKELREMLRTEINPEINPVIHTLLIEVERQEK